MKTKRTSTFRRFKNGLMALLLPAALCSSMAQAQTTLVNPATDGGFELLTGSLADNGWTQVSAASNDTWYTGNGAGKNVGSYKFPSLTNCAYISGNSGAAWGYVTTSSPNVAHIYKTITVPAGQTQVTLSFKYQLNGSNNTRLMVAVCPSNAVPSTSQPSPGGLSFSNDAWGAGTGVPYLLFAAATPNADTNTQTFTTMIPQSFLNNCTTAKTFKLVFMSSRNASGTAVNPPPAIDSVSVISQAPSPSASGGTFTINNTLPTAGTNFKNFTDAINWVNAVAACGISNPIIFNVSANQTFDENTPYITASATETNQITFRKNGSGANPIIRPNGNNMGYHPIANGVPLGLYDFGICLYGADYITFDGIDINSNNVSQTIAVEFGYLVKNSSTTNGANNNTIKNCTIILDRNSYTFGSTTNATRGIVQTATSAVGNGYTALNANGTNNNNSYYNITIGNVNQGIIIYGAGYTLPDRNTRIGTLIPGTFNMIGRTGVPNDIGNAPTAVVGIQLHFQFDAVVSNNIIQNLTSTTSAVDGIGIGSTSGFFNGSGGFNNEVSNNQISNLTSIISSASTTITGMRIQHDNIGALGAMGFKIYNNTVSNITATYTGVASATRTIRALWLQGTSPTNIVGVQYEVVNNTLIIDGSSSPNLSNIVFENAYAGSILKLRNNIFYNTTGAQSGAAVHSVLGITGATTLIGTTGSSSNYNDFYYTNPTGGVLSFNGTSTTTIAAWRTLFGVDANSISADPKLSSTTILYPVLSSPVIAVGPTLSPPYNRDILNKLRASGNSTLGAFERYGDFVAPVIVDTTIMGINSTASRTITGLLRVSDYEGMVANTAGVKPRLYFKKSTDANVFGANTSAANGWKWVEATNTTSPFDFTINYSLLQTAVGFGNVIQYFFVVQDTVLIPNVAALPSAGFVGASVSSISSAPTTPKSYVIYNTPAAYVSSTTTQASTSRVMQSSVNNAIIRVALQTGATGDSAYVTDLSFNSATTTDLTNISAVKVWYTGLNGNFIAAEPTNKQFGATYTTPSGTGALGTVAFTGAQITPPNSTVYFWLTYDIKTSSTISDVVDASAVSITYNGAPQTPVVVNPAGTRAIKQAYCVPVPSGNRHISFVTLNTLNNNAGTSSFLSPFYVNYAPLGAATTTLKRGLTYNISLTQSTASTSSVVYIDFNDNGIFDAAETFNVSINAGVGNGTSTMPITIPCDAVLSSEVRMRVVAYFTGSAWATPCTTAQNGEMQDYTLSIIDNPADYISSSATQYGGTVTPSAINKLMMQLPIVTKGCGASYLTEVRCHTAKTMNAGANIASAKLYSTGRSNIFTTAELLATVASPTGPFNFVGFSDSLYSNTSDTNYYWIVYNTTSTATLNDTIDVRIDSINAAGRYVVPGNNNPAEYLLVKSSNTYINSEVTHPTTTRIVRTGQLYTPVLRVRIVGTNTGAPLQLTQMNINPAGGGNDVANITSARVFYTGNSATFTPTNQFGDTYLAGVNVTGNKWNTFNITGVQDLNADTNYFWLAYDLKTTASTLDSVDADLVSFTFATSNLPTTKSVAGSLKIKPNYCFMGPSGSNFSSSQSPDSYEEITNVQFGTINNTSACGQTGGVGSVVGQYSDYSDIIAPANVMVGDTVRFILGGVSNCNQPGNNTQSMSFVIMADWNQNGTFDVATEVAYRSAASTSVRNDTNRIFVPCTALPGNTRMRIIFGTGSTATNTLLLGTACGNTSTTNYIFGETEDYTINVLSNPTSTVLSSVVQQTGLAGKGITNIPILRVAVKQKGCGATLNALNFRFSGNSLADITSVKLYADTNNVFSPTTSTALIGTVAPAANISFTGLTTILKNNFLTDSTYLWLTYDVATGATSTDTLDARLDSLLAGGVWYNTTAKGNPAGLVSVVSRMSYTGANVTHPDLSSVAPATPLRQILRVEVTGSASSGPIPITGLSFNVNGGGNNGVNIDSARLYYTGTSTTFATTTPFGIAYSAAPGTWGSFNFTGNVTTSATSNNFWLVYDIKTGASTTDSVDAEFTGVTFDGTPQTPVNGAPASSIKIRNYCTTTAAGTSGDNYVIMSTTIGGVTNSVTTKVVPFYVNYSALPARNLSKGPNNISVSTQDFHTTGFGGYTYIYIDYDQNGDFTGTNEFVGSFATPNNPAYTTTAVPITFTIPCTVKTGVTRMRLMASLSGTAPAVCGASAVWGETEDYTVNIQENPLTFQMSSATQPGGTAGQGKADQLIMNIKVKTAGCGVPTLTNMYFNTIGSTNPTADILAAKLYKTGSSPVFTTANLIGTVTSPNGAFNFTAASLNDVLVSDDTTNYWLVYDISPLAINNDTIDVRVDSIIVMGVKRIPNTNAPAAFKKILTPMSILDITALYPAVSGDRVAQATSNHQALCVRVIASSTGATLPVTALNFNTIGGGADVNNLTSARVYYTGNNKTLTPSANNQFGATYTAGSNVSGTDWLPFTITGYQELATDTNYFWLTFDVKATATIGDSIDAEIPSLIISGATQTTNVAVAPGNAIVRQEYCFSSSSSAFGCIDTAIIGTLFNATSTACASYTNYPKTGTLTTSVYAGSTLPINLILSAPTRASVFIDLNKNGIFETGEEYVLASGFVPSISTSIIIPANAKLGDTRMRLRTFYGQTQGGTDRACSNWNQSETEDYTITILPALPQTTYTWNNAGTSNFTLASNWTPARNAANPNDILVFNSPGTALNLTNVFTQTVAAITVTQATVVNMNASGATTLQVTGTLTLNDSARINGNSNIIIEIGESTGNPGLLVAGNVSGIDTKMKRWVNATNSSNLTFPFRKAKGTRSVTLSYSFAPLSYGSIVASFIPTKALGNFGFPLFEAGIADLTKTCAEGYWEMDADNGLSGGVYAGSFSMDSIAYLPNPYTSTVINRTEDFNPWVLNGNHSSVSAVLNGTTTINRVTMQNFGQFTIAGDSTQNPLPVTLTLFTAKTENTSAVVQWNTSSEVNNKGFDLERSVDGRSFEQVIFVKGYGTSSVAHSYMYNDVNAFTNTGSNVLYYRLKQMDFDGKISYSKVVKVASYMQQAGAVSVYPNPFDDAYTVAVDLQNDAEVAFVMTDIQGKTIATETVQAVKGNNSIPVSRFANLEAGVYFLRITVGGESQVIKMIKK